MPNQINLVKVFSVAEVSVHKELGERVTSWIAQNPEVKILRTFVSLTSDSRFHCLSMVLMCATAIDSGWLP